MSFSQVELSPPSKTSFAKVSASSSASGSGGDAHVQVELPRLAWRVWRVGHWVTLGRADGRARLSGPPSKVRPAGLVDSSHPGESSAAVQVLPSGPSLMGRVTGAITASLPTIVTTESQQDGVGHTPKTDPLADALLLLQSRGYTIEDMGLDATASSSSGVGGLHTSGTPQTGVYQQPMFPDPVGSFGQCIMPTYHRDSGMESSMPVMVPESTAGSTSQSAVDPTMMQMMRRRSMWNRMRTLPPPTPGPPVQSNPIITQPRPSLLPFPGPSKPQELQSQSAQPTGSLPVSVPAPVQKEVEVSQPRASSASPCKESAASLHGEAERLQQGMRHYQLLRDKGRRRWAPSPPSSVSLSKESRHTHSPRSRSPVRENFSSHMQRDGSEESVGERRWSKTSSSPRSRLPVARS